MINLAPERTRSNFVPLVDDKVILDVVVVETPVYTPSVDLSTGIHESR